jgi:hypothetical protein
MTSQKWKKVLNWRRLEFTTSGLSLLMDDDDDDPPYLDSITLGKKKHQGF